MKRRRFLGVASAGILSGLPKADDRRRETRPVDFRPYRPGKTLAPISCVTPDDGFYIHTFFDICPWSPSQRYLACLRLPFQDRLPDWRDTADVCVIDLDNRTIQTVYTTSAFGMQTGAQVQWGTTDRFLYFNDKTEDGGFATAMRLDWQSGKAERLAGPIYHIAPDESGIISFDLELMNHVQDGYGCVVAPERRAKPPVGAPKDQGIWFTDLKTNRKRLLLSLAEVFESLPYRDDFRSQSFYLFHLKYNRQGTRIMQVVRTRDAKTEPGRAKYNILTTLNTDGSDVRVAIDHRFWARGGHHPTWHPDGQRLTMNLVPKDQLRFCQFRFDGSDFRVVSEKVLGSGHPRFESTGRYLFTDAYPHEPIALANGEVPLRLFDARKDAEMTIATIFTLGTVEPSVLRLDPHPAWSRDGKSVCFNGAPDGRRQLFIADLSGILG